MVNFSDVDVVFHDLLQIVQEKACRLGAIIVDNDGRDVVDAKIFIFVKNIILNGPARFTTGSGTIYHHIDQNLLKEDIYERVSGTGSGLGGEFLHHLIAVENRDCLITMCVMLDSEQIWQHWGENCSSINTKLANRSDRNRIFTNLLKVAAAGIPRDRKPITFPILRNSRTSIGGVNRSHFQKLPAEYAPLRLPLFPAHFTGSFVISSFGIAPFPLQASLKLIDPAVGFKS